MRRGAFHYHGDQPTCSHGGNLFRRFPEGGVGLHTSPRLSNIHKVNTGPLEFPFLLFSFPDGIDIGSEAEKKETFRRRFLNFLRTNGDSADERRSGQQDRSNEF